VRFRHLFFLALPACSSPSGAGTNASGLVCDAQIPLAIQADAPPEDEAYTCFAFDAAPLAGQFVRGIDWTTETSNPVLLHHAGIYASPDAPFSGSRPCDAMPEDNGVLHVWAPGSGSLTLPDGVAIVVPPGTRSLVVQAHGIRLHDGAPMTSTATLCTVKTAPAHEATWLRAVADTPTIPPNAQVSSTSTCKLGAPLHLYSTRPHMHRVGSEFHSQLARADGSRAPIVDVVPWVWNDQKTYPLTLDLSPNDAIVTTCTWKNAGDQPVTAGLKSTNEMCHQGFVAWPADQARWAECK
jgi:hypothetical protein